MDPAAPSGARECCRDGNTQGELPAIPGRESGIANSRSRETEASNSELEEKERTTDQASSDVKNKGFETALLGDSQAESSPTPGTVKSHHQVQGDLTKMRSLNEDKKQAEEFLALGVSAYSQFERTRDIKDIDKAIDCWRVAATLVHSSSSAKLSLLSNLGCAYDSRFEYLGEITDSKNAIDFGAEAVSLTPDGHPNKANRLKNLGNSYSTRFGRLGELSDLDKAIQCRTEAVSLTPDGHLNKPGHLSDLGVSYWTRFGRLGELPDLNKAIKCQEGAVLFTSDDHLDKPGRLSNLGVFYNTRFHRLGELPDLNKAIECKSDANSLTPDGHPNKPECLHNLGASYLTRFSRLDELSDLNKAIECQVKAISLIPNGHPRNPAYPNNLGVLYRARFGRLGELQDLNKAIDYQTDALLLTSNDHPDRPERLSNLGISYRTRFGRLGELSDLNKAVEFQAEADSLTPEGYPKKPEFLSNLGVSYWTRFGRLGELSDLDKAIECQTKATPLTPDDHPDKPGRLSNLGASYSIRFERLGELPDLNKAIESQAEAISLTPDGHPANPTYLNNLGNSYWTRFGRLGELPDLNKALQFQAKAVSFVPDGHANRPICLNNLGVSYWARFGRLGELSDLNGAIECQVEAVSLTPDDCPDKPSRLSNLGILYRARFGRLEKLPDLDEAIKSQAKAVLLAPGGHPNNPRYFNNLGNSHLTRFSLLGELTDLDKAIECQSKAVSLTPEGHPDKLEHLNNLGSSYRSRFEKLGELSDLQSAEASFKSASESSSGPPSIRFHACRQWAALSLFDSMPSPFPAYQKAISLIPQLVWIGTTIDRRYELVAEVSSFVTEAASYAISTGILDLALEWLEAGRSVVWGQITQLRTSFKHLSGYNQELAEELASVGRQLELAGSRPSLLTFPETIGPDLAQEANTHIQLALRWEKLLEEVRLIPGFKNFLRAPAASQLLSTVKAHPIAVINLHKYRCDALILQPGSDVVSHVTLPNFSFGGAVSARRHVFSQLRELKDGHGHSPKLLELENSLESLWFGVVKPVLDFLGFTRTSPVDQLPRITWCTTGLLSFLPLHAARGRDKSQPGAFDLVVSSYTPTLSALVSSQPTDLSSRCGILAVGQASTPGFGKLPCTTQEIAAIRKHAASDSYLPLEGNEATVERVLDAMACFNCVHMACHGSQNATDPTKSAFHLHDGNLTLADITKRSFTNKGLAFLSACQTATGDKNMPDEAVHLAAGMLIAGYPSVICTMWSIADKDGPEVADLVYAELLKHGKMDYANAARALHRGVAQLRTKVGERAIERWAPFIHIGI